MLERDNSDATPRTVVRGDHAAGESAATTSVATADARGQEANAADVRRFSGDPISSPALMAGLAWSGSRPRR